MYTVKRYTVSVARERFSEVLDEAQRGVPVIIERKGVKYRVSVEAPKTRRRSSRPVAIEILDQAVAEGRWTWDWTTAGLKFRSKRRS
jgi:antitoxin (DNA-binding transcriptional repressor) of toxin-antitoxin stability system